MPKTRDYILDIRPSLKTDFGFETSFMMRAPAEGEKPHSARVTVQASMFTDLDDEILRVAREQHLLLAEHAERIPGSEGEQVLTVSVDVPPRQRKPAGFDAIYGKARHFKRTDLEPAADEATV